MKVLVACEFSGIVRDAFIAKGHDAISCDLLPTERPGPHIQGDVRELLREPWDLVIAHPPCTYQAHSGSRWLYTRTPKPPERLWLMLEGLKFFQECRAANAPLVAVENPRMNPIAKGIIGPSDCEAQPWWFNEPYSKATGLWLKGLPPLMPAGMMAAKDYLPWCSGSGRGMWAKAKRGAKDRAQTFPGMAAAMAQQWGGLDTNDHNA